MRRFLSFAVILTAKLGAVPSLPLVFEPNAGQAPKPAAYVSRARGHQLLFSESGVTARFQAADVRLKLIGSDVVAPSAERPSGGVSNYLLGSFRNFGVPHFERLSYPNIYPGIDWVFYGNDGRLEFDFVAAPGSDPRRIKLMVTGAAPRLDLQGNLDLGSGIRLEPPAAYQERSGKRLEVKATYRVSANGTVTFALGSYDRSLPLVIDPVLTYSTYLGGSGTDSLNGFAVDSAGNTYLTGSTESANFPAASALQPAKAAAADVFVTKLNQQGGYVYSTFIGGDQADRGNGIAVDGSGNVYLTGVTESTNYPLQSPYSTTGRMFVTKLSSTGAIVYSTRIPGTGLSEARKIAVDGSNQAVITGTVFGGLTLANAAQSTPGGGSDAFLLKLNAAGSDVIFATYLGGAGTDVGSGIASDSVGNTWVTGSTTSASFPVLNPFQGSLRGLADAFIARYGPSGNKLYATYLGTATAGGESGLGAAADSAGRGCVAGSTSASDFPMVNATFPSATLAEGWIACFNADHSMRLLQPLQFRANAIAVSSTGRIAAAGEAPAAFQIPVLNPVQAAPADFFRDAFFTVLEASGTPVMASYLGGGDEDFAVGVGFDSAGALYLGGQTTSVNFLRTPNASQLSAGGLNDGFAARIDLTGSCLVTPSPNSITAPASGGNFSMVVAVAIPEGPVFPCPWNMRITNPFFNVPAPNAVNADSGTVPIAIPANTSLAPRFGGIQLPNGQGTVIYQHGTGGSCGIISTATGQTQQGSLSTSSCRSPYRVGLRPNPPAYELGAPAYGQLYSFVGTAGQRIAIDLTSSGFDPYLYLFSAGGTVLGENDDQVASQKTGATNSRIPATGYITLPSTGTYYVDATTFLENATGSFNLSISQDPGAIQPIGAVRFVPVFPCRVADTRDANGLFGGPILGAGQTREFLIGPACGIPLTARAYSLNVTAVPPAPLSFLTVWPAGASLPLASTLNSFDGSIVANAAIVPAGVSGAVNVYATHATHVILDINGYFVSDTSGQGLSLYTAAPCRVADTRNPGGPFGGPQMTAGGTRDFAVPSSSCGIPSSAQAYSMNVTVVPPAPLAFLTAWPTGQARPQVSTLNSFQGAVVANAAIVPAGANGAMSVFTTHATDVILDVNAYFAPPGGANALRFFPVTPCRVTDTRNPNGPFGGPQMAPNSSRDFTVPSSACGIPANARAYSLNVTVVPQEPLAFLTAWPAGSTRPLVSTLNSFQGKVVANAAIVPAGTNGAISVFVTNRTDVILDINGYFAP